jgi:hypothetical protein
MAPFRASRRALARFEPARKIKTGDHFSVIAGFSSPARARTTDPMVNSHLLCQLSYRGISNTKEKLSKGRKNVNTWGSAGGAVAGVGRIADLK